MAMLMPQRNQRYRVPQKTVNARLLSQKGESTSALLLNLE